MNYSHIGQGDVTLVPVKLPTDTKPEQGVTVAYGEVTGHHHTFKEGVGKVKLHKNAAGTLFVQVLEAPVILEHQEHNPITIDEKGTFEVRIAREYQWGETRKVLD